MPVWLWVLNGVLVVIAAGAIGVVLYHLGLREGRHKRGE